MKTPPISYLKMRSALIRSAPIKNYTKIQANMKKDKEILEGLIPFFQELRDAFFEASKKI